VVVLSARRVFVNLKLLYYNPQDKHMRTLEITTMKIRMIQDKEISRTQGLFTNWVIKVETEQVWGTN